MSARSILTNFQFFLYLQYIPTERLLWRKCSLGNLLSKNPLGIQKYNDNFYEPIPKKYRYTFTRGKLCLNIKVKNCAYFKLKFVPECRAENLTNNIVNWFFVLLVSRERESEFRLILMVMNLINPSSFIRQTIEKGGSYNSV